MSKSKLPDTDNREVILLAIAHEAATYALKEEGVTPNDGESNVEFYVRLVTEAYQKLDEGTKLTQV